MSECSKIFTPTRAAATIAMRSIARPFAARGLKTPTGAYFCSARGGLAPDLEIRDTDSAVEKARGKG